MIRRAKAVCVCDPCAGFVWAFCERAHGGPRADVLSPSGPELRRSISVVLLLRVLRPQRGERG